MSTRPGLTSTFRDVLAAQAAEMLRAADADPDRALAMLDELENTILAKMRQRHEAGRVVDFEAYRSVRRSLAVKPHEMAPRDYAEDWSS